MIQRSQTVYLFLALVTTIMFLLLPLAALTGADHQLYHFGVNGTYQVKDSGNHLVMLSWPLLILEIINLLIYPLAIFLYKKRKLQMRLCVYVILLQLGGIGLMYYYLSYTFREMTAQGYSYKLTVVFPLIAIILTYLAFRGIRKDELLVRSFDRIR